MLLTEKDWQNLFFGYFLNFIKRNTTLVLRPLRNSNMESIKPAYNGKIEEKDVPQVNQNLKDAFGAG